MAGSRNIFSPLERISTWRRLSVGMWGPPMSPVAQGEREIDLSETLPWLEEASAKAGQKITVTHLFVAAVGRMLAKFPDYNVILRRNKPWKRTSADVFVQVAVKGEGGSADLSGVKVLGADQGSIIDIANQIGARAKKVRAGQDKDIEQAKSSLKVIPPVLVPLLMKALSTLSYDFGLDMTRFGLKPDPFGSAMVTNVGGFDIPHALVPLMPTSRVPILFCLGQIHERPRVVDGQVVARPTLILTGSFDHRLFDGYQIGQMTKMVDEIASHPSRYDLI
ncbi:MAG: 2-oxo acid dehydrogenase subunit E2 [Deltaproteobacteria bacterium]|nr:2-oxo acid dehydrogenase subunit E2 [Deltaproteobacteria bacterium]